jgi:hypothetical protein
MLYQLSYAGPGINSLERTEPNLSL